MFEKKHYFVSILSNQCNTVLYSGVTNDLFRRITEHKQKITATFTTKYHVTKLVYVETFETAYEAISREKQLKAGSRARKINLIKTINPERRDLSNILF